jgi:multidrug efflux pump subunit AcrB
MIPRPVIDFFARHPVASTLLTAVMLVFGVVGLTQLNRQVLPDFTVDIIAIGILWPGASPADVESNIIQAIEPEVRFLDDVSRVQATAFEGRAQVLVNFTEDAEISKALTDVQAAVARIVSFPADIEKPLISRLAPGDKVCRIILSGPLPEATIKRIAQRIRDDLLNRGLPGIDILGARKPEIWVEVDDATLRRMDLTLGDIATRLDAESLDLPAGVMQARDGSRRVRSEGLARTADSIGNVEIVAMASGEKQRVRDIAKVREAFEQSGVAHVVHGEPAIQLVINREKGVDSIRAQKLVTAYLDEIRGQLPPSLRINLYDVQADQVSRQLSMLAWDAVAGMLLALIILFMFMNARIAFWVAWDIPVSILAACGIMAMMGLSLNMISMFAMIMGFGIICDDAVVVGEHSEYLVRSGLPADVAALHAARSMSTPVMAAALVVIASFFPILTIGSTVGLILRDLPITMIAIVIASTVECFLCLPTHLARHALPSIERAGKQQDTAFIQAFNRFRDNQFRKAAEFSIRHRYSTVFAGVALFVISVTMLITGHVGFEFRTSVESTLVFGNFALSPGSSREATARMVEEMGRAARAAELRLTGGKERLIEFDFGTVGAMEGRTGGDAQQIGDHIGAYTIELTPSDMRNVRTREFLSAWEQEIRPMPGVEQLTLFEPQVGGGVGHDIDIRLSGADLDTLKAAAMDLRSRLNAVPGTLAIQDNLPYGMQELAFALTPTGHAMGFTTQSIARQVRNAFEGGIAKRFPRDQEEVIVRVKLSEGDRPQDSISDLYVRAPDGTEVPLSEVVELHPKIGFSQILREDGVREVAVMADVDSSVTTSNEIVALVDRSIVPEIRDKYAVDVTYKGRSAEQREAFADFRVALLIAMCLMYAILAWAFQNYLTPFLVLSLLPFSLTGAVLGHWALGIAMTIFSLQALMGLAGVIINDSIILVATVKRSVATGTPFEDAIISGTTERLRQVVVTNGVSTAGLLPLILDTSTQAQLVMPLAVTMAAGLMVGGVMSLFFVPSFLAIGNDLQTRFGKLASRSTQALAGLPG